MTAAPTAATAAGVTTAPAPIASSALGGVVVAAVHPVPDPAMLAALVAAVDQVWPRSVGQGETMPRAGAAWRFSGRWWAKPTALRRDRPWARR